MKVRVTTQDNKALHHVEEYDAKDRPSFANGIMFIALMSDDIEAIVIPIRQIVKVEFLPQEKTVKEGPKQLRDLLGLLKSDKEVLKKYLAEKPYFRVTFLKKDGSERVMYGTTNTDFIPVDMLPKTEGTKKPDNPALMRIFSIGDNAWRSFRLESLLEVPEQLDNLKGTPHEVGLVESAEDLL